MKRHTPRTLYVAVSADGMPWGDACLNRELADEQIELHQPVVTESRLRVRKYRLVPRNGKDPHAELLAAMRDVFTPAEWAAIAEHAANGATWNLTGEESRRIGRAVLALLPKEAT